MQSLVIYHASCFDGFCAAWLFKQAFPNADFHAASYGTTPPDVKDRRVFVADFCYKRGAMLDIHCACWGRLTILDHHKTSEADLKGFEVEAQSLNGEMPTVVFDINKSGGRLTWEYLYGNQLLPDDWLTTNRSGYSVGVAPWLVDYTEDRDMWWHKLPESREVNACLRSLPMDFGVWDTLRLRKPHDLAIEGTAILRHERQIVEEHVKHAREMEIGGHKVPVVNATVLFSEIAGELANGKPFGACYFDRADGMRQWSLRSRDGGMDVSEVAKAKGGGGHRHAAGFEERLEGK